MNALLEIFATIGVVFVVCLISYIVAAIILRRSANSDREHPEDDNGTESK